MNKVISQILNKKLFFLGLFLAIIFAGLDLYSKIQIFAFLDGKVSVGEIKYPVLEITSFFNLVQVWNTGVSFGMFNDLANGKIIIICLNLLISLILLIWLFRNNHPYLTWALALIIGGAMGNLVDRIMNEAVADFLDFHILGYHWPAFNLADSFVFIGVGMLLLENLFIKNDEKQKN